MKMTGSDKQADVVIIGSGFAGLSAAIEAAAAGASVVVLEKMMAPGGNSIISDGGIAAPGTQNQADMGIADSPEQMFQDMLKAGEGLNHRDLLRTVTERALEAFIWSKDVLGVRYESRAEIFGGHSVARCYTPEGVSGKALIKALLNKLAEYSVPVCTGCYVSTLLQDESGRVTGLKMVEGYRRKNPDDQKESMLQARRGIVVASGGFGSDVPFRQAQDPRLDSSVDSTNKPFATAELLKECMRIGANSVQLSHIQLGPWTSPDEKGFGAGPLFADYVVFPYGIVVAAASGRRFVNELADRKILADAILKQGEPAIGIADSRAVTLAGWDLSRAIKKNVVRVFDSIAAMAAGYGIAPSSLQESIDRFNEMLASGDDRDYSRPLLKAGFPIAIAPFYAMRLWPKVHHTMGGLQIDSDARVIHRDQYPIPGLFAAGEVCGGVHGACRLGSCAITECLVFGRIAGRNAALYDGETKPGPTAPKPGQ